MTLDQYLNADQFPRTTRKACAAIDQLQTDFLRWRQVSERLERGETIDESELADFAELAEKMKHREACEAELKERDKPKGPWYLSPEAAARVEAGHRESMQIESSQIAFRGQKKESRTEDHSPEEPGEGPIIGSQSSRLGSGRGFPPPM